MTSPTLKAILSLFICPILANIEANLYMENKCSKETQALIIRDFELDIGDKEISDEELFDHLANQVAYMIEYRLDFLLSLMYRLDILEYKINDVLHNRTAEAPNIGLARLIVERQKERIFTKQHYKQTKLKDLDDEFTDLAF